MSLYFIKLLTIKLSLSSKTT